VPFADRTGDNLCRWLGLDRARFYDREVVAILPLGLCYPGRGRGDLPPRPECAPRWPARLRALMPEVRLTLLLGRHAQAHHLGARRGANLAATVQAFGEYLPRHFPLPPVAAQRPVAAKPSVVSSGKFCERCAGRSAARCASGPERYSAELGSLRRCLR
jgi:uracil-DNA glycosylase